MAGVDLPLPGLSEGERRRVRAWLAEFEREWDESRLAVFADLLPPANDPLRLLLLIGLVRIDLCRRWDQGRPEPVENYLRTYPELGPPDTVAAELLVEEFEARLRHGHPADPEEFGRRFPGRAEVLWEHLRQAHEPPTAAESVEHTRALPSPDPSATLPRNEPGAPPEQFGRYRIVRPLGRGGMGTVYLAHDTELGRPVALKIPHFAANAPTALERFYREARAAATLDHPNLCPVYDVGQCQGVHYLTMPYIEGESLSQAFRAGPPPPERQVAELVRRVALALEEAHRRGIIHRDLKPSNVMLNRRGEPVVMDFGLARRADGADVRLTQSGAIVGTPAYMPPEQVDGADALLGPTCDVYSLGVILYELLTGRLPFRGSASQVLCQILRDEPQRPSAHRPDLDLRLETICLKAMAKRISARYPSMADLAAALDEYLRQPEAPAVPPAELVPDGGPRSEATPTRPERPRAEAVLDVLPAGPPPGRPRRRRRWPLALLGCLGLVLVFCGGPVLLLMNLVPRAAESIRSGLGLVGEEINRQTEWMSLAMRWHPPPEDAGLEQLFPTRMGEYGRLTAVPDAALPEPNTDARGRMATYRSGAKEVQLYALRANSLEREAIFERLIADLDTRKNASRQMVGNSNSYRLRFSLGPSDATGFLWWSQGWLFVALTRDTVDVEAFLRTYLDVISRSPPPGPKK